MSGTSTNAEDAQYLASIADARQRAVVAASLAKHRQADSLSPGDPLPPMPLTRLAGGEAVNLSALGGGEAVKLDALAGGEAVKLAALGGPRPLVLIFGSYT